jgi:hypothetical protein
MASFHGLSWGDLDELEDLQKSINDFLDLASFHVLSWGDLAELEDLQKSINELIPHATTVVGRLRVNGVSSELCRCGSTPREFLT